MTDLDNLKVSLTKNGYLKIAQLVISHPSHEILDHVYGSHVGVNLVKSQVGNVLGADPTTDMVPPFWDEIREYGPAKVKAFTFLAIVFSHHRLVEMFLETGKGEGVGTIMRSEFQEKEYTNLVYAMSEIAMCGYSRGSDQTTYSFAPVNFQLRDVGTLVGKLLKSKLQKCGWRDPEVYRIAADQPVAKECVLLRFNEVFGMAERDFIRWIQGPRQPR